MRALGIVLIVSVLFLTGCYKDVVLGTGDIVSEQRRINGTFSEILVKGSMDLFVQQGDSIKVVAKDFSNVLPYLTTRVSGNRLVIDYEDAWIRESRGEVTVTLPKLTGIEISGSSEVGTIGAFKCDDLLVNVSGSGNINLVGTAKRLNLRVSGSGDFRAFEMPTDTARITISGSGKGQLTVNKLLDVVISGSGDVIFKGNPNVTSQISGSGRVRKF
jgi:hypothetical protein